MVEYKKTCAIVMGDGRVGKFTDCRRCDGNEVTWCNDSDRW